MLEIKKQQEEENKNQQIKLGINFIEEQMNQMISEINPSDINADKAIKEKSQITKL